MKHTYNLLLQFFQLVSQLILWDGTSQQTVWNPDHQDCSRQTIASLRWCHCYASCIACFLTFIAVCAILLYVTCIAACMLTNCWGIADYWMRAYLIIVWLLNIDYSMHAYLIVADVCFSVTGHYLILYACLLNHCYASCLACCAVSLYVTCIATCHCYAYCIACCAILLKIACIAECHCYASCMAYFATGISCYAICCVKHVLPHVCLLIALLTY